jgi:CRISPR-associated protein (TIGR02710 family)
MTSAMIVSLGGTAEPIARSIREHQPELVCFLASQQSVVVLGKVHELLERDGVRLEERRTVLLDDADDLVHCYEKALECCRYLEQRQIPTEAVMVDYTGGTKNMTAALALATVAKGYQFSYVGGSRRSKGGLGVVEDGFETVHTQVSPWQLFAVEEWRQLVSYTEHYQYEAALSLIGHLRVHQPTVEALRWEALGTIVRGLLSWDQFNHKEAQAQLAAGLKSLAAWVELRRDEGLRDFRNQAQECLTFLNEMAQETRGFKDLGETYLVDLLANADRRADQGAHDDAVARLYRVLEMRAQIALKKRTGASTGDVPEAVIPESLRDEYRLRYRSLEKGIIQLPLFATYRLLQALDDPVGHQYFARKEEFEKILSARNSSILAHGDRPIGKAGYESLRRLLGSAFEIQRAVRFPRLSFPF